MLRLTRGGLPLWLLPALPWGRLVGLLSLSEALEVSEAPCSSGARPPAACRSAEAFRFGRVSFELPAGAMHFCV